MGEALSGTFGFVLILLLFVVAVLWFLLPFAVFGTKARMDKLIEINQRRNVMIESVYEELHAMHKSSKLKKDNSDIPMLEEV